MYNIFLMVTPHVKITIKISFSPHQSTLSRYEVNPNPYI